MFPINPVGCASIGLKYLKEADLKFSFEAELPLVINHNFMVPYNCSKHTL